jgi:hypothetical protein
MQRESMSPKLLFLAFVSGFCPFLLVQLSVTADARIVLGQV